MSARVAEPLFVVDAFTGDGLAGNPAGVCPLSAWPSDATMQSLAFELALSETAFFAADGPDSYLLRWFTPETEVDLCGHATLAAAAVFFRTIDPAATVVRFSTRSAGDLAVTRNADLLELDFPSQPAIRHAQEGLSAALGAAPLEALSIPGRINMAVFGDEGTVRAIRPDMARIAALDAQLLIATAPGAACDFVSRCFAPRAGIPEDPVTGSAHTMLVPYWSKRLDKPRLHAKQISERGGELFCTDRGDRVGIAGRATIRREGRVEFGSMPPRSELAPV
ncbi:MAG: PhzF family phenazine biosynthesis protein [Rhodospirillales bacterium]|nr:MAG: PhzF family phenazine biosynthesis protein [Rhodospirillales bacterium]